MAAHIISEMFNVVGYQCYMLNGNNFSEVGKNLLHEKWVAAGKECVDGVTLLVPRPLHPKDLSTWGSQIPPEVL